jgi:hypothetical protein
MIIRRATQSDAAAVSKLLVANTIDQGGTLVGDWREPEVASRIARDDLVLIAREQESEGILGVLLTQPQQSATAPPVLEMLKVWPGRPGAYVYGPVCVDAAARGRGVLKGLYGELIRMRPGAEGILFIRAQNEGSLEAHRRLGAQVVAEFLLSGERYLVLSTWNP